MIWHIFKKDLRLMWPLAAALVSVAVIESSLRTAPATTLGPFVFLLSLLPIVIMLGIAFITVIVVQQDNLVGDRDDWLLRPIPTHSVLAAKLLFVALALHAPLLLIDIVEVARTGISPVQSLAPAMSHQLVLFCLFTTPALMIGAATRSLVGALTFSVGVVVLFFLIILIAINFGVNPSASPIGTGYSWVVAWTTGLIYVVIFICLARFQFRQRRATVSRIVGVMVTAAAFVMLWVFPWGAALQAQQWITGSPVSDKPIVVAFSPDVPPQINGAEQRTGRRGSTVDDGGVLAPFRPGRDFTILDVLSGIHRVELPVQIDGLPAGAVLASDRGTIRVANPNGDTIFATKGSVCVHPDRGGSGFACVAAELRGHQGPTDHGTARGEFLLPLPTAIYEEIKDQPVRISAEFTLTLLLQNKPQLMQAVSDKKLIDGIGGCTTGIDRDADEIEFRCMTAVRQPSCIAVSLQDPRTGSGNPVLFGCDLDYAPFPANWMPPALVKRGGADLPFLDPDGLAHYPVNTSQINDAQVVIVTYVPKVHFTRQLVIPTIRLVDWDYRERKPAIH
jgi:hypothetical protein